MFVNQGDYVVSTSQSDRTMLIDQLVIECKIKHYSVHCARSRKQIPSQNGSTIYICSNEYFIDLDKLEMIFGEPVDSIRIMFVHNDPGWLGDLDKSDGSISIRIMLPGSEFTQYYDLLRNEKDVYLCCAFEQKKDDLTGDIKWLDIKTVSNLG